MSKSNKVCLAFCGLAFLMLLASLFLLGEREALIQAFGSIRFSYVLLALGLMVIYWLCEAYAIQVITDKVCPGQRYRNTFKTTLIGQYYNCVTPLASGGQPMQAFYMSKYGVPASASISILMSRLILYHIAETLYCLVVLLLRFTYFTQERGGLMALALVGFGVCSAFIVFLILASFCKGWTMRVVRRFVYFFGKLHLVKNPEKTCASVDESLNAAFNNMKFIVKEPVMILKVILLTAGQLTAYFSISYVIYRGFGLSGTDFLTVISCQAFVYMISAFMPTPGAMGAAEGSYIGYFSTIYGDATTAGVSSFIWRFLTFYVPIIVGILLSLYLGRVDRKKASLGAVPPPLEAEAEVEAVTETETEVKAVTEGETEVATETEAEGETEPPFPAEELSAAVAEALCAIRAEEAASAAEAEAEAEAEAVAEAEAEAETESVLEMTLSAAEEEESQRKEQKEETAHG